MNNMLSPIDVLNIAIRQEIEGELFYRLSAEKTEEIDLRVLLSRLAEDEKKHVFIFKSLLNNLQQKDDLKFDFDEETQKYFAVLVNALFPSEDSEMEKIIEEHKSILDVLLFALQKEKEALHLYSELNERALDGETKNTLTAIIKEERDHFFSLSSEYQNRTNKLIEQMREDQ